MTFVMNSSKPWEEWLDIHIIAMDSVALGIIAVVYQHNYGAINVDDPEVEGLYVVQFKSITYIHY